MYNFVWNVFIYKIQNSISHILSMSINIIVFYQDPLADEELEEASKRGPGLLSIPQLIMLT